MRQVLIKLACTASLVVASACAFMWVRSLWHADEMRWFIQLPDPTEDDWQGLLGVYRIYSIQSSRGAVGCWVRSREVWLSTPFPEPGFSRSSTNALVPPNCSMGNAFAGGDARCFPNDWGFALRWDVDQPTKEWPYVSPWRARMIVVPWWLLVTTFGALPGYTLVTAWKRARFHRLNPSLCRNCGYDLRATPQRCPECGTAPSAALPSGQ